MSGPLAEAFCPALGGVELMGKELPPGVARYLQRREEMIRMEEWTSLATRVEGVFLGTTSVPYGPKRKGSPGHPPVPERLIGVVRDRAGVLTAFSMPRELRDALLPERRGQYMVLELVGLVPRPGQHPRKHFRITVRKAVANRTVPLPSAAEPAHVEGTAAHPAARLA